MPSRVPDRRWHTDVLPEVESAHSKIVVRVIESLDVLTPQSHVFSYVAARNICILPKQWDLIERPMGHGQPFLSLLPDPLNSSSATRFAPPHP